LIKLRNDKHSLRVHLQRLWQIIICSIRLRFKMVQLHHQWRSHKR